VSVEPATGALAARQPGGRRLALLFFASSFLLFLAFSPGRIAQMGYMPEVLESGRRLLERTEAGLTGAPGPELTLPRHGAGDLAAALPFLVAARLAFGPSAEWADRVLSLQPVLATALLCTILFVWTRRETGSAGWGAALGLLAGLSTMLWPYAYIGLETTQSLFVFLAAFLALATDVPPTWKRTLAFAASAAVAVSVKTASVFLVPAVAWLAFCLVRGARGAGGRGPSRIAAASVVAAVVAVVWALCTWSRFGFWSGAFRVDWLVASPLDFAFQAWSLMFSTNKGLLVYCPLLLLPLLSLPAAFARNPRVVTFAVLVLAGQVFGASAMFFWADETWGPRYLHSSVVPLALCIAVSRAGRPLELRREWPLFGLGAVGAPIAFLGCLFWQGHVMVAAMPALVSTIENYQYDKDFNHIRFNARLARLWLFADRTSGLDEWPPRQTIWYPKNTPPPRYRHRRQVSLLPHAFPQPALLAPGDAAARLPWIGVLALGTGALGALVRRARSADRVRATEGTVITRAGPMPPAPASEGPSPA
jgi:hypothetical protein